MTLLLASVTGPAEAEIVLAHGADIVDLKDPGRGALGALPPETVRTTVVRIAGRRPASAVTGDLPMQPDIIMAAAEQMAMTGVDYVKVGLFPEEGCAASIRALATLARRTKLVGVLFADRYPDPALIALMAECGFAGAMLDTADKRGGRLLDHAALPALGDFVRQCRAAGLMTGLAGSLEAPDVPRLLLLSPDYLGFRGALCVAHDRKAGIEAQAVSVIRGLIPGERRVAPAERGEPSKGVYRLLAARGYSEEAAKDREPDRVFVHDLVLPVRIGAYGHERAAPQNVRFSIDAEIAGGAQPAQDMRDVLSYDLIVDGIRLICDRGHIDLAETLAEEIATFVLGFPRVERVAVKVEKLEVGPGRVGVAITRRRPAEVAKVYQLYPAAKTGSSEP